MATVSAAIDATYVPTQTRSLEQALSERDITPFDPGWVALYRNWQAVYWTSKRWYALHALMYFLLMTALVTLTMAFANLIGLMAFGPDMLSDNGGDRLGWFVVWMLPSTMLCAITSCWLSMLALNTMHGRFRETKYAVARWTCSDSLEAQDLQTADIPSQAQELALQISHNFPTALFRLETLMVRDEVCDPLLAVYDGSLPCSARRDHYIAVWDDNKCTTAQYSSQPSRPNHAI